MRATPVQQHQILERFLAVFGPSGQLTGIPGVKRLRTDQVTFVYGRAG
jgi:hypothetical protein